MTNNYDIVIKQGSFRKYTLIVKSDGSTPDDLSEFTARMQVRPHSGANTLFDELTTSNSRIVITGALGKIELFFPDTVSSKYRFGNAVYDLELLSSGGVVTRLLQGSFTVDFEVTV